MVNKNMFKLFRSVKEEITTPIEGDVIGDLPEWIIGSVYRNGPGLFEVGDTKFFHWFDGMAIIQRFDIKNGKVNYQRKFLESEAYKANITANRIVFAEFGTRAYPDPNKNIIVNLLSKFIAKRTDNCPVNIIRIGKELFAVSETNYLHRFDPNTLETLERLNLSDLVDVNQASAHVHYDQTGTIHNIGYSYGVKTPKYCLYTITPTTSGTSKYSGKLIAALGIDNKLKPSYIHSFFMTENFYIYIEQPLVINALKVASAEIRQLPMSDCLEWRKDLKTRFHIVDRKTGIELNSNYVYEGVPFMMINQGNAFEDGGNIVLDLCAFKDGEVLNSYFMCNLAFEIPDGSPEGNFPPSTYQRFVLPLNLGKTTPIGTNLLSAAFSKSLAVRTSDTKISLTSEALSYVPFELPLINEKFRGKPYQYVYGVTYESTPKFSSSLVKLDIQTKACIHWKEDHCFPSQPSFLPSPHAESEDDGVLIATVNTTCDDKQCCLIFLNAKTMTEICRVTFPVWLPRDLHGIFVSDNQL